jgi:hypothetical protein
MMTLGDSAVHRFLNIKRIYFEIRRCVLQSQCTNNMVRTYSNVITIIAEDQLMHCHFRMNPKDCMMPRKRRKYTETLNFDDIDDDMMT